MNASLYSGSCLQPFDHARLAALLLRFNDDAGAHALLAGDGSTRRRQAPMAVQVGELVAHDVTRVEASAISSPRALAMTRLLTLVRFSVSLAAAAVELEVERDF